MTVSWSLLAHGSGILEAPAVAGDSAVYFSDVLRGGVYRLDPAAAAPALVVPKRRGVGGIVIHRDGGIVITGRDVRHVGAGEDRLVLGPDDVPAEPGLVTSFNDITTGPDGELYVGTVRSDPARQRGADELVGHGELICLNAARSAATILEGVASTNGSVSGGGRVLQADSGRRIVNCVRLDDGAVSSFSTSAVDGVPDGMAADADGNLWIAFYGGGCIACFTPSGLLVRVVTVPAAQVTSLAFGHGERVVYVTTGDHAHDGALGGCLFASHIDVTGASLPLAAI